jgi:hypothetical protein
MAQQQSEFFTACQPVQSSGGLLDEGSMGQMWEYFWRL